jgi:anti-sigma-K factor RskA
METVHPFDLLPAYALGGLSAEEQRQVEDHLQSCPDCRAEVSLYRDTAGQLAYSLPQVQPPARLKAAILDEARASQAAQPQPARRAGLLDWLRQTGPAWALAAVVLLVGLAVSSLSAWNSAREFARAREDFRLIGLTHTDSAPQASGLMVISADGTAGSLIVDGLPPLGPDQQYQLWLLEGEQRTSGGVFSVDEQGYGALWVQSPKPLVSYSSFGITIEPAGGSPGPTGPRVLGGEL